jgi:hypothetical protein
MVQEPPSDQRATGSHIVQASQGSSASISFYPPPPPDQN